jgi:hypothetical protein
MSATVRVAILTEILHKQDINIILLQRVTNTEFGLIREDIAYTNVEINKRGSTMLNRETKLANTTRLLFRWEIATLCRGVLRVLIR